MPCHKMVGCGSDPPEQHAYDPASRGYAAKREMLKRKGSERIRAREPRGSTSRRRWRIAVVAAMAALAIAWVVVKLPVAAVVID